MAVVKRISALVALLVIPAGLAWAGQALGGNAGSPDVGNASITVSVEPSDDAYRGNGDGNPVTPPSDTQVPPAGVSEAPVATEGGSAPAPGVAGAPAVPPTANMPAPASPPISDVQRQPIPAPQQQWDDDWDDDRDDGGDDDWDDDADEDDDWDDDGE